MASRIVQQVVIRTICAFILFCTFGQSYADNVPASLAGHSSDWVSTVSSAELNSLIKLKVKEISALQNVWGHVLPSGAKTEDSIYLAGGRLRILLTWIDVNLQKYGYDTVKMMQPPSIDELSPIPGVADKDLFVSRDEAWEWLKDNGYASGWDILNQYSYDMAVASGGSAIEKVRVSPTNIEDPYGAIESFRNKVFVYVGLPRTLGSDNGTDLFGNHSYISFILRAIRHQQEIPRAIIAEATWSLLKKQAAESVGKLKPDDPKVEKSLSRLHYAMGKNLTTTRELLKKLGIIETLEKLGYNIGKDPQPKNTCDASLLSRQKDLPL